MKKFNIHPVSQKLTNELRHKIDFKTKPVGALGELENIALRIGLVQNTLSPTLNKPVIVVFAGDHGITQEGVSAYPQEVTYQMVMNFLNGGAAINVFCKQNKIGLRIVDAGVNYDFPEGTEMLIDGKIGKGTKNFLKEPAMSIKEAQKAIDFGAKIVKELHAEGSNIIGFGEMGIGNTSSASALLSIICGLPVEEAVGKGTGLDENGVHHKATIIKSAIQHHGELETPLKILATFGGFEIAQMVGAMLQAAELGMIIMVDGFIASAAFLVAHEIEPNIFDYAVFCHQSEEPGHKKMLNYLKAQPLLNLNMRLGEGTGAAVVYPVIEAAVSFLNEMASFESAGVSPKEENELA
jgi:nicotinate-nucleotide--dimethylbenzimidazole phosphoribosyltransferase